MLNLIFAWYNLPFWGMMFFVLLLLGSTVFLGHFEASTDTDTDLEIDTDVDVDADVAIETDLDTDVDTDIDAGVHVGTGLIHASMPHTEAIHHTGEADDNGEVRRRKTNIPVLLIFKAIGFLNEGKVPLSMTVSTLLAIWGAIGLITNTLIYSIFHTYPGGGFLFSVIILCSFIASVPFVKVCSKYLGQVFESKSYHTSDEDYIGSVAIVVSYVMPTYQETIDGKSIGILDLVDEFGTHQKLYAFIPDDCETVPKYNDNVVIIDYIKEKRLYKVLVEDSNDYLKWQK